MLLHPFKTYASNRNSRQAIRQARRRAIARSLQVEPLESRRVLNAAGVGDMPGPLQNVVVVLNDDVADARRAAVQLVGQPGQSGKVGHTYEHALKGFSGQVYSARMIEHSSLVKYVEPDGVMNALGHDVPTGVDRIDADENPVANIDDIDGENERVDVDIAIIDTGIDTDHPDLNVHDGVRFYSDGGPPWNPKLGQDDNYDDDNGHGTHVAGTAAAIDDGVGVVGVAPGARLWAVKVLDSRGSGSVSQVIAGMDWVAARADEIEVANMSLGGGFSQSINDALLGMTEAGIVVAVAAGNDGVDAANYSPASAPTAITVSAAVDTDGKAGGLGVDSDYGPDDTLASFSNYGEIIDIAAPGVDIYSTYAGGGFATLSGTSMASPHVAGAAALEVVAEGRDRDGNGTIDGADVSAITAALVSSGQPMADWRPDDTLDTDSDPDQWNEPMVNVGAAVDQPPSADDISATTDKDTAIEITLSGSDAESVELTFEIASHPSSGTLSEITDQDGTAGDPNHDTALVTYTPDADYNGTDSFTYTVSDPSGQSDTATVTIAVTEPPTADDLSESVDEDESIQLTLSGSDAETVELEFEIVSGPDNGSLGAITNQSGTSGDPNTDTALVTYTPDADYNGSDSFIYRVTDADGAWAEAVVSLTVNPVNDAPVAEADGPFSTEENTTLNVAAPGLLSNDTDVDGDDLAVDTTPVVGPSDGTLTLGADGSFQYVPNTDFTGQDTFEYQVSDGNGGTDTALVTIDVNAATTSMHVGDLDGTAITERNNWRAEVTVAVVDANGNPVSGATVHGDWSGGYSEPGASATTDESGEAMLASGWIHKRNESTTFTVTKVEHETLQYEEDNNTDPDGDSNGTGITVFKDGTTAAPQSSSVAATDAVLAGALDDLFDRS